MNKKLFLGMFAAVGMLFATSCQNDELDAVQSGNEATVSFTLGVEGGVKTRAISDGTGAKKLVYAVYDASGELLNVTGTDSKGQFVDESAFKNGLTHDVTITLAKGQTYTVAFWAQNGACTAYNTDDLKDVKVTYPDEALNNDESRDAFYVAYPFKVTGHNKFEVELKRPFAQINVGVTDDDWNAAIASGIEIETSKVVIKKAATSINLLDGTVSGETDVTYNLNTIPHKFETSEILNVDMDGDGTKEAYKYLSMSYILVNDATTGAAKATLEDLDLTFHPKSGLDISINEGLQNVPVQRNWRTNIIGQLLTGNVKFSIKIVPAYDGDHNYNPEAKPEGNNTYEINSAAAMLEIASIIAKTAHGEGNPLTFKLTADINMSGLDWTPLDGLFVNIDGQGHTISNLNCLANATGKSGLFGYLGGSVVKNLNLENVTAAGEQAGIIAGNADNCTIENVTILGTNYVNYEDIAVYNETYGGVGAVFGVNSTGKERSVGVTIAEDAVIYVEKTGLTTQAAAGNKYAMLAGVTLTADNGTVLEKIANGLYGNSDTKTYHIFSADGLMYANENLFEENGNSYKLMDNIDMTGKTWTSSIDQDNTNERASFVFDGNGKTISNWSTNGQGLLVSNQNNQNITIQNLNLDKCSVNSNTDYGGLLIGQTELRNCEITINNVKVTNSEVSSQKYAGALVGWRYGDNSGNLVIKDCSVESTKVSANGSVAAFIGHTGSGTTSVENATVTGCTIKGETLNKSGIVIGTVQSEASISIKDISGNKVYDIDNSNAVYGRIVGGVLYMDGTAIVNGTYITNAITKGVYNINLTEGNYTIPSAQNKTLTFVGVGNRENVILKIEDVNVLKGSMVTFDNLTLESELKSHFGLQHIGEATYKNCRLTNTHTLYGPSLFEDCIFEVAGNHYNVWTYGTNPTFRGCTFNCDGKAVLVYQEGKVNDELTFDKCVFNDSDKLTVYKAAIELAASANSTESVHTVYINNCTVNGFSKTGNDNGPYDGDQYGNNLWGNKNLMSADQLKVVVDGTEVY